MACTGMEKMQFKTTYFIFGSLVSCEKNTLVFNSSLWPWRMSYIYKAFFFFFFQCSIILQLRFQGETAKHSSYSEKFTLICLSKLNKFQRTDVVLLLWKYSKHYDLCKLLIWKSIAKVNMWFNCSTGKKF